MSVLFALAIYAIIWWVTLFTILPIGMRTQEDDGNVIPGTPESAPAAPRLLIKVGVTTVVSAVVFAIVYAVIVNRWIDLDSMPLGL